MIWYVSFVKLILSFCNRRPADALSLLSFNPGMRKACRAIRNRPPAEVVGLINLCLSADGAFEGYGQQFLGFDGELHGEFVHHLFGVSVHNQR